LTLAVDKVVVLGKDACLSVFNEIDEEQSGTITARKFNRYMD
jgi:hypothetical protein